MVGLRSSRATVTKFMYSRVKSASAGRCDWKADRGQVRVDPDSQVVCRDLKDMVTHPTRIVRVVRECLGIRQQQVLLVRRL